MINDRTEDVSPVDDQQVILQLSRALSNAIMMSAQYSGGRTRFFEKRPAR